MWDLDEGQLLSRITERRVKKVGGLCLAGDGSRLFLLSSDQAQVTVWDTEKAEYFRVLDVPDGQAASLSTDRAGDRLVVSTRRSKVYLWDVKAGTILATLPTRASSVVLSSTGKSVVLGQFRTHLQVWDLKSQALVQTLASGEEFERHLHLSDEDDVVLAKTQGACLGVWDPQSGTRLHQLSSTQTVDPIEHRVAVKTDGTSSSLWSPRARTPSTSGTPTRATCCVTSPSPPIFRPRSSRSAASPTPRAPTSF